MYHTCYPDEEGLMAMDNRKPRITEYFAPDLQFSDCRRGNGLCLDMIYPYEGESGFIWAHPMDCGCDGQRGGWISPRLLAACIEARSARF